MRLAERLRAAVLEQPMKPLYKRDDMDLPPGALTPAAVLIAVTDRVDAGVILTVRRADLRTHAGQVAFPGGRIDPGEGATEAAIREAWEELGLAPEHVEVAAVLDRYRTGTGYEITPVLAAVPADLSLAPHEAEVADWFEAPLSHLLDPANQVKEQALFAGRMRNYYRISWEDRTIWGATAAIIVNLSRRLRWP